MTKEDREEATVKLENIDDKLEFMITILINLNIENCFFNKKDVSGLYQILTELQRDVKEANRLLD